MLLTVRGSIVTSFCTSESIPLKQTVVQSVHLDQPNGRLVGLYDFLIFFLSQFRNDKNKETPQFIECGGVTECPATGRE